MSGRWAGLAASAFAREVDHFIGIDLSPGMIDQARATGLYATLEVDDMVQALRRKPDASAELVLAADAMVYVSDLMPVLGEVKRVLTVGGLVAFTLETHGSEGVVIGEGLRYAHGAEYVRKAVSGADLKLLSLEEASPRTEDNQPVRGLVVVARRS